MAFMALEQTERSELTKALLDGVNGCSSWEEGVTTTASPVVLVATHEGDLGTPSPCLRVALGAPLRCSGSFIRHSFQAPMCLHGKPLRITLGVHKEVLEGYLG